MTRAMMVAAACALQLSCSLAFVPRPPPRGNRCAALGRLAFPIADLGIAVASVSFGALRTFDPLCDTSKPCRSGQKEWSALAFGVLIAAPFAISSGLGFAWRSECQRREPPPLVRSTEGELQGD